MAKELVRRWLPSRKSKSKEGSLKYLGPILEDPYLFHINRHSVAAAFFVGLFVTFLPIPGHMIIAAIGALIFRCNLPIVMSLVWITNPFTALFIFYGTYKLGQILIGLPSTEIQFEPTWQWLRTELSHIWQPLLLGSLITSTITSIAGYFFINWLWRRQVIRKWERRKQLRNKIAQ